MKNKFLLTLVLTTAVTSSSQANTVDFLFGAGSFGRSASPIADCRNIFQRIIQNRKFAKDTTWKDRVIVERKKNFLNDKELIDEIKYRDEKLGVVNSKFIKELDTRIYYTATAKADANGEIPMVDKDAKALVIYFHGSGTSKASGSTFAGKMNALAKLGYSTVSFDLPFHADGSRNPLLTQRKAFTDYVEKIVQTLRVEGMPIILTGHSFGPDVIAEYVMEYPHSVNSIVLLSPGGFDNVTKKWFSDKTVNMVKTFGEVEPNNAGGHWAGKVTYGRTWSNPKAAGRIDPTIANPNLKVFVISGDKEEYIPGELDADGLPTNKPRDYDVKKAFQSYFQRNLEVTIEPGVGHYIFAHTDSLGQDVVLRSILKANNESLLEEKAIKKAYSEKAPRTIVEQFAIRFNKDVFFKEWVATQAELEKIPAQKYVAKIVNENDTKTVQKLSKIYDELLKFRMDELVKHIKNTETWAPDFFQANRADIEALGTKGFDGTRVQSKYFTYLSENENSNLLEHYTITKAALQAKEQEIKKGLAEKTNKNPLTVIATRFSKESKFKEFVALEAQKYGKSAEEYIADLTATSNEKEAQQLMKAYESTRKQSL